MIILSVVTAAVPFYLLLHVLYLRFLHPLHRYPGPFLATVSRIPYTTAYLQGRLHSFVQDLHRQYGSIVRIAPDELSFVSDDAWTDIYSNGRDFPKNSQFFNVSRGVPHLATCKTSDVHSRQRRAISHVFLESALRDQEPILLSYVDLLIRCLREHYSTSPEVPADLTRWYNYTTFDFTAKYVVGDALACLETSGYHPWLSLIFDTIRASASFSSAKYFPMFKPVIQVVTAYFNKDLLRRHAQNYHIASSKLQQRLQSESAAHPDFVTYIQQNTNTKSYLTPKELQVNSSFLMIARSETTATQLAGVTFLLLTNPQIYNRMVHEIRSRFLSSDDINFASLATLPYLRAVLQEALRLYPPTPLGMPRVVPASGAMICGDFVPGKTTVSVPHYSANRSPAHFTNADQFVPERWLGDDKPLQYRADRPGVFQPFSAGSRNCLGKKLAYAEGSLILAKVLWHFDLSLENKRTDWMQQRAFMVWEKMPLLVKLVPR